MATIAGTASSPSQDRPLDDCHPDAIVPTSVEARREARGVARRHGMTVGECQLAAILARCQSRTGPVGDDVLPPTPWVRSSVD
jgi:hypothetical protein